MNSNRPMQETKEYRRAQRKKGIWITIALTVIVGLLSYYFVKPTFDIIRTNPEGLKTYIEEKGFLGVLYFIFMLILQVFSAIIPAGPYEVAAGYAFGVPLGTLICIVGIALGSALTFLLSRRYGMRFVSLFVSEEKLSEVEFFHTTKKQTLLYFFFVLVPGLPKDTLTFVMGLTDMKFSVYMLINIFARIPSVLLTVMLGETLKDDHPWLFLILAAAAAICYIAGFIYIKNMVKRHKAKKQQES